jgi:hypothetical protein
VQVPQLKVPPQPSPCWPQLKPSEVHVPGTHAEEPQTPAPPPPPQVAGAAQVPQLAMRFPQPSPAGPQLIPCSVQVSGTHVAWYGVTHDVASNSMNSRIVSWSVIVVG